MFIKEAIVENFMSYTYARIPFRSGINVICGPNGSGKSSILLAVSVALGQSYTERSRKLSELVRWGENRARVTLILDNSKRNGKRPVPRINSDELALTRYLDRNGKYWFELNERLVRKRDVLKILSRFGLDPENMLLIMHQDMVGEFIVLPPEQKLGMMEAAIGFESYRKNLMASRDRLERIVGKERSLKRILTKAKETLAYWKRQYERLLEKRRLALRQRFLERALAWEKVVEEERVLSELETSIKEDEHQISSIKDEIDNLSNVLERIYADLPMLKKRWRQLLDERIRRERKKAAHEATIPYLKELSKSLQQYLQILEETASSKAGRISLLKRSLKDRLEMSLAQVPELRAEIAGLDEEISQIRSKLGHLDSKIEKLNDDLLGKKVNLALLRYRGQSISQKLAKLKARRASYVAKIRQLTTKAQSLGPKALVGKELDEILDEISRIRGRLISLAEVKDSAEKMYETYLHKYNEIKTKVESVSENRRSLLDEIEIRTRTWKNVIEDVIKRVNTRYQAILSRIGGTGYVSLDNPQDIGKAGLELFVGFKGGEVRPLNAYTQSGGEKSVGTMAFLLALQQFIKSPFRAIDEYDLHMDPSNREAIFRYALSALKGRDVQYIFLTPGQLPALEKDIHILTVQATHGVSTIRVAD